MAYVAVDAAAVAADLEGVDVHSLGGVLLDDPLDAVHAEAVRPVAHPVPDDHGRRRGRGCELYSVEGKKMSVIPFFKDDRSEYRQIGEKWLREYLKLPKLVSRNNA